MCVSEDANKILNTENINLLSWGYRAEGVGVTPAVNISSTDVILNTICHGTVLGCWLGGGWSEGYISKSEHFVFIIVSDMGQAARSNFARRKSLLIQAKLLSDALV